MRYDPSKLSPSEIEAPGTATGLEADRRQATSGIPLPGFHSRLRLHGYPAVMIESLGHHPNGRTSTIGSPWTSPRTTPAASPPKTPSCRQARGNRSETAMKVSRRFVVAGMGWRRPPCAPVAPRRLQRPRRFPGGDLDAAIEEAIRDDQIPGRSCWSAIAVRLCTARPTDGAPVPAREPMTLDTVFDAASLTKRGHRVRHHAPVRARQVAAQRRGDEVPAGVPGRPQRDHHTESADHFSGLRPDLDIDRPGAATRREFARRWPRRRSLPPAPASFTATSTSSCSAKSSQNRRIDARGIRAPVRFRAAGDAREHVPAAARLGRGLPLPRTSTDAFCGRRSRRIGALYGRHRRQRRTVYHRGRSGPLRRMMLGWIL